jgi:hypothetical protein
VIVTVVLTACANDPSVAVNVYVPVRSMLQPAKLATPWTAFIVSVVHETAAPPPGTVIARCTELELFVTVPPTEFITVTVGWRAKLERAAADALG